MKRIAPALIALSLAFLAVSGRPASAAILGVPSVTTVGVGGTTSVPVTLTTGNTENITFSSFDINVTFDPSKFAIDASSVTINPALTAGGSNFTSTIVGGNDLRVSFSKNVGGYNEIPNTILNLFNFNLTALPGTAPGDYTTGSGLGFTTPGFGIGQTNVSDTSDNQYVTGTSSGLIRVTAVPEPSQVAILGLLGSLGAFKGVSLLARARRR